MVRLFHVYYPVRRLLLLGCEMLIVCGSFLLAIVVCYGADSYLLLNYQNGYYKVLVITAIALLASYYFELYAPQCLESSAEIYSRLLMVLGLLSIFLAAMGYFVPSFTIGRNVFVLGLFILTFALLLWRTVYNWMMRQAILRKRVYVIGGGERAAKLVSAIHNRIDLGMEVVGWAGATANSSIACEDLGEQLRTVVLRTPIDRIIIAMNDRRGTMPVRELLNARLHGINIEDATSLMEKINGKIEVADFYPSSLIFSEGFRLNHTSVLVRRALSFSIALLALVICLPIIPLVALVVKLSSPGQVLFRQKRVGLNGLVFTLLKFRTMCQDAEAETGAVWACKDDPRVTRIGSFLRKTRLDEIPQLWNVLKGDMAFVGPRPERPEFVRWLSENIPFYQVRNIIRPGITGWAQVRYQYGASLADSKEKLCYDLYYVKHMSLVLDMFIMLETIKIILIGRGAR